MIYEHKNSTTYLNVYSIAQREYIAWNSEREKIHMWLELITSIVSSWYTLL